MQFLWDLLIRDTIFLLEPLELVVFQGPQDIVSQIGDESDPVSAHDEATGCLVLVRGVAVVVMGRIECRGKGC